MANFTPVERTKYEVCVPDNGEYEVLLDSDWKRFGGATPARKKIYKTKKNSGRDNLPFKINVNIKGLSCLYLKKMRKEEI